MEAWFERSVVLTYAFPAEQLRRLLPDALRLDTFEQRHAFVAAAAVQTRSLRPRGWPRRLGRDFLLMGYRIFVRYESAAGRRLRGLYILRSETDSRSMALLGNLFTSYRYTPTDVRLREEGALTTVRDGSGLAIAVERAAAEPVPLPAGSPFADWRQARRFAGPLPFTFSVEPGAERIVIIEGVRESWAPRPVQVVEQRVPFVESLADRPPVLASAFTLERIPYRWKRGRVERWRR